ncbi:unnamed protein product [Ectocarpus sp. 6 AP-2014]
MHLLSLALPTLCLGVTIGSGTVEPVDPVDSSYLGCFSDPRDDRMFVRTESSDHMTAEVCSALCADSAYYGTQYYHECWCGADTADYDANGAGVCELPCAGDSSEICGGHHAMSVYSHGVVTVDPVDSIYLGCFSDPAERRIFVRDESSDDMTAEACAVQCADYAYYGTQYSHECWCGDNADYDANGAGECELPCAGDSEETCGGHFAMSVYTHGVVTVDPVDSVDPAYLGCYYDPSDDRIFMRDDSSDDMTAEVCSELCADYLYYGTQWSRECWCGDNAHYDEHGESECDMACTGDAYEICGGNNAMSVYKNDKYTEEPAEFSCSGDTGVLNGSSCCEADCGACGGSGCSKRGSGADSCCTSSIQASKKYCSDTWAAPCIV